MNTSEYIFVVLLLCMAALFFNNIKTMLYPDKYLLAIGAVALLYIAMRLIETTESSTIYSPVVGSLALAAPLYVMYGATGGKYFGYGDVKLALLIGLLLGFPASVITLVVVVCIGFLITVVIPKLGIGKRLAYMRVSSSYIWFTALLITYLCTYYLAV